MVTRGLTDEMSCPVLSGPHNKDSPSGASRGHSWVPGTSQGPMGFLGTGSAMIHGSCLVAGTAGNDRRTRGPGLFDPQGVAVLPGGALLPAPSGPHQQGPPHGSALAANTDPHGFLATRRNPWVPPC